MALAKERGYKPDSDEQAAYNDAVNRGAVDGTTSDGPDSKTLTGAISEVDGKEVPDGGCAGDADRRVSGDATQTKTAQSLSGETFIKSQQNPAVVKAFKAWSDCMKGKGYNYAEPLDASDDPAFSSQDVTRQEIATATADISCRQKTNVAKIWFDAEVAMQQAAIEEKVEQLGQERKRLDGSVKKAADVLAGSQ